MSEVKEVKAEKTGNNCPVCGGNIISITSSVSSRPSELVIFGPGGEGNFREEKSFHCEDCGVMFAFPPQGVVPYRRERPRA